MRFALTPEQETFRDSARRFLAERVRVREQMALPGAHDPALWEDVARMGWLGGEGLSFFETALLAEEAGRALMPGPFLGTLIALEGFAAAEPAARQLPVAITQLHRPMAVALDGEGPRLVRNRLRGEAASVACAEVAELLLVVARTAEGPGAFLVRSEETIVSPVAGADLTRPISRVRFEGARFAERFDGAFLAALLDRARVLVAADAVGGAAKALEMAVSYAKDRVQFERPIGSFQAVKHRAADAWRMLEAARLAVWYAAWAIANSSDDAPIAARAAKAAAGDAFVRCSADSIQIHGGIGFTWEHDAHLYYRRALADQSTLGDAASHREALAADVLARA